MGKRVFEVAAIALLAAALIACGGPEEKKAKFFDRGKELFEQGDYVKAALEFKNAVQIDPKFAAGHYMLGRTIQRQGDLKNAFNAYAKAVKLDPELLEAQLEMGRMLLMAGRSDEALEKAELIVRKRPGDVDALLLKASALLARRNSDEAIDVLEGLREHALDRPEIYLLLATAYARAGKSDKAEAILIEGVSAHPDFVPLYLGMVRFYGESMQPGKAESAMRRVIELEPDNIAYRFNLAELYWREGRQAEAIETINRVIDNNPDSERVYQAAARFYSGRGQLGQAAQILESGAGALPESYDIRILLGEVYANQKKPEKAVEVLKQCLTLSEDPDEENIQRVKNALARVLLSMRRPDEAERYTDEVLERNPKSVEAHLNKGDIHLQRGEGASAVSEFRVVVSDRPGFIPAYLKLAGAHMLNEETELAVNALQDALKTDDTSADVRRMLARIQLHRKDFDAAEAELRKIVAQHPDSVRAKIDLGDFMTAQKRFAEAENVYSGVVEQTPDQPLAYLRLAQLERRRGRPEAALAHLKAGYTANPLSAPLLTALIQTYVGLNRYQEAIGVCRQRIEANPRDVFAYNLLGWVGTEQKNYGMAEEALKKAIEMQPLWPAPHNNLARLYLRQGKKAEAVKRLRSAIRTNPKDATGYLTLALIYEQDRDVQSAIQVYEAALKENPDFWFAANNLAFLITEATTDAGSLKRARKLAERAVALRPDEPAVLDTMAWVHYRQGDYNRALGLMEQALESSPNATVLNYHMGMILLGLGREAEARQALEKALSSGEDFMGRQMAEETLEKLG